jgi:hypothetical protein
MKLRRLAVLAVAILTLAGVSMPTRAEGKKMATFGIAFYNLENLFDTINNNGKYDLEFSPQGDRKWDGKKYWSKINNLGYAISQMPTKTTPLGPAVIGVSEVENESVLKDLVKADAIKDWDLKYVHHDSPDRRGIDVSLLYNPKLFRVLRVQNYPLEIPELPNFKTRDQMCVLGLLGNQTTGYSRVAIIVNHWPSRRGGEAESSWLRERAAALTDSISKLLLAEDPNIGIVVMGDLNDDPNNKSVSQVLEAVKDIKKVKPGRFFNPFWEKLDKGIGSYIYRGGWDLFDQIIVNSNIVDGACGVKYYGAEVLNKQFLLQSDGQYKGYPLRTFSSGAWTNGYSDHLPTEIFLVREIAQ